MEILSNVSGPVVLDQARDSVFELHLAGDAVLSFVNSGGKRGQRIEIHLIQDATGGRQVTLPDSVAVFGALDLSAALGGHHDVLTLRQMANPPSVAYSEIGRTIDASGLIGTRLAKTSNLSDVANPATARTNLGLAPVASTGQYASLTGKPSIPATYGDLTGTVPTSALPALAINDTFPVADQAAMLALSAQRGDIAIRQDRIAAQLPAVYILAADAPGTLANWILLPVPADAVVSVAGRTGAVVLGKGDVGLGNVDNTSDASKPVSTATQTALDAKQPADADLTAIAGLTPADNDLIQRKAGAWTNRTLAQVRADLGAASDNIGHACRMYANAAPADATDGAQAITVLDTVAFNSRPALFTPDTTTGSITVQAAGRLDVSWCHRFGAAGSGERSSLVAVNGTARGEFNLTSGTVLVLPASTTLSVSAGDVITLQHYVSGGTVPIGSGEKSTNLSVTYLGA